MDTSKIISCTKTIAGRKVTLETGKVARQATASVITDETCEIYFLSHENFEKLNKEAPDRAAELHTYVIKLLSDRLAKSNATIHALMQ